MPKIRIKTGDVVKVISGKEKGKSGKVIQVFPSLHRVVVEGLNTRKRHMKGRQDQKGQTISFSMPLHVSNVLPLVGEKTTRHSKKPTS